MRHGRLRLREAEDWNTSGLELWMPVTRYRQRITVSLVLNVLLNILVAPPSGNSIDTLMSLLGAEPRLGIPDSGILRAGPSVEVGTVRFDSAQLAYPDLVFRAGFEVVQVVFPGRLVHPLKPCRPSSSRITVLHSTL